MRSSTSTTWRTTEVQRLGRRRLLGRRRHEHRRPQRAARASGCPTTTGRRSAASCSARSSTCPRPARACDERRLAVHGDRGRGTTHPPGQGQPRARPRRLGAGDRHTGSFRGCRFRWRARSRSSPGHRRGSVGRSPVRWPRPARSVMLTSRKQDQLELAAAEIAEIGGRRRDSGVRRATPATSASARGVRRGDRSSDSAVSTSSSTTPPRTRTTGRRWGSTKARFDKTFQVNLRGPLFWCQAAWEQAMRDKPGVIINIASVGGLRAEGALGVYNLTKAALIHMTRQLGRRARPAHVSSASRPGW